MGLLEKLYHRIYCENDETTLSAETFNRMDIGLDKIDDRLAAVGSTVAYHDEEIDQTARALGYVTEDILEIKDDINNCFSKDGGTIDGDTDIDGDLNVSGDLNVGHESNLNDVYVGGRMYAGSWSINKNGEAKFKTLNGFDPDYFLIHNTATGDKIEINDGIPSFNGSVYSLKMEGKCDQWGPGTPIVPIKDPFIYALSDIVYYNDLKLKRGTDLESLVVVLEPGNYKIITNVCENPDSPNHVYAVTGTIRSTNPVDIVYREKIVSTDEHGCIAIAFDNPGRYEMWNGHYFICSVKAEDAFMGAISNFIELGSAGDVKDELYLYPDRSYRLIKRVKHIVPSDYNIDFKEHPEAFILPQPMIEEGTFAGLAGLNFVGECTVFNSGLTNMEVTYYADLKKYIDSHSGGKSVNTIPTLILAKEV